MSDASFEDLAQSGPLFDDLMRRLRAAAPDLPLLTDPDIERLAAWLGAHPRPRVSFSRQQREVQTGETAYRNEIEAERNWLAHLRATLAFNRNAARERSENRTKAPSETANTSSMPASAPRVKVTRWEDLAIGIDHKRTYFAVSPPPEVGAYFTMSGAVALSLAGKRWQTLLELLAQSETGDSATTDQAKMAFGLLMSSSKDSRMPQGRVTSEYMRGIQIRANPLDTKLNETLRDLRRELRRVVDGPDSDDKPLQVRDSRVHSRFVVRYLMADDSGKLRFGQRA